MVLASDCQVVSEQAGEYPNSVGYCINYGKIRGRSLHIYTTLVISEVPERILYRNLKLYS